MTKNQTIIVLVLLSESPGIKQNSLSFETRALIYSSIKSYEKLSKACLQEGKFFLLVMSYVWKQFCIGAS